MERDLLICPSFCEKTGACIVHVGRKLLVVKPVDRDVERLERLHPSAMNVGVGVAMKRVAPYNDLPKGAKFHSTELKEYAFRYLYNTVCIVQGHVGGMYWKLPDERT